MSETPFVSVVTPFYNTAPYLAECIESVLAQTHTNYEYLLVDNKSSDGSREIAECYARRDARIRVFENAEFLDQLRNFNGAIEHISPRSAYVKMALADDLLFPECLERMVAVAEREPRVALVSSHYLYGEYLLGGGLHYTVSRLPGREACRRLLLAERHFSLTGTPTTVLYRADVVRERRQFFDARLYHADVDRAFEILLEHDLGYVHQALTFVRFDNESISSASRGYNPLLLHKLLLVERHGATVLEPAEFERARREVRAEYQSYLGRSALRFRDGKFWAYHRTGLATIGWNLRWRDLMPHALKELLFILLNPQQAVGRIVRQLRSHTRSASSLTTTSSSWPRRV